MAKQILLNLFYLAVCQMQICIMLLYNSAALKGFH